MLQAEAAQPGLEVRGSSTALGGVGELGPHSVPGPTNYPQLLATPNAPRWARVWVANSFPGSPGIGPGGIAGTGTKNKASASHVLPSGSGHKVAAEDQQGHPLSPESTDVQ